MSHLFFSLLFLVNRRAADREKNKSKMVLRKNKSSIYAMSTKKKKQLLQSMLFLCNTQKILKTLVHNTAHTAFR